MFVLIKQRKYTIHFFLLLLLFSLLIQNVHAQESGLISPTPSSIGLASPSIPDINPETLRDPSAFKLDQQIKQATHELFQTTDSSMQENKASYRKTLMKQAIQKYPYVFLGNALTSSQIASLDAQSQPYVEKSLILSNAELGVMHIDDFENHTNSRFDYSLQNLQERKQFNFYPASSPNKQDGEEAFGGHISGTTLNVNGVVLDDDMSARVVAGAPQGGEENNDPIVTTVEVLKEASPDALGPQRVAVILIKTKGATFIPYYSKEQIEEMIFRGDVQKFFKEASYDKMWLDEEKSKVYGWYEVENLNIDTMDNILDTTAEEIINITDADINFAEFDRVIVGGAVDENTYGGWGNVGKKPYFTSDGNLFISVGVFGIGSYMNFVFSHEFGHNLGVYHANSWDCDQGGVEGNCKHHEYGNFFDVMGGFYQLFHFNGYFKEVFQWLNKPVINITSSGRYNLQPLEHSDAVVAKISRPEANNFPIYYLEKRIPIGFDYYDYAFDRINGIHINWVNKPLETRFLTLIPRGRQGEPKHTEPLKSGQSFQDEKAGLTITNIDDTTVDIQIQDIPCKNYDFDVIVNSILGFERRYKDQRAEKADLICDDNNECLFKRKQQGELTLILNLDVKNNNSYSCPDANISAFFDSQLNIEQPYSKTNFIANGDIRHFSPDITIPATISTGIYRINAFVENKDTGQRIFSMSYDLKIVDDFQTLEGDLNNDEKVDIFDLVTVARDFGKKGEEFAGDADHDGDVDIFPDLFI